MNENLRTPRLNEFARALNFAQTLNQEEHVENKQLRFLAWMFYQQVDDYTSLYLVSTYYNHPIKDSSALKYSQAVYMLEYFKKFLGKDIDLFIRYLNEFCI